jgi:hypothetical protein
MADTIVQLVDRKPVGVVRVTFGILTFDKEGRFDSKAFQRQQFARAELGFAPAIPADKRNSSVVDASSRFVSQGGQWAPSRTVARAIDDAAMGRIRCPRV